MRSFSGIALAFFCCLACVSSGSAYSQDWPQWRGPNRDGKAVGFQVPGTWPKQLALKWKVPVGDGVATPALVGDKLFVLARQGGNEIIQCLDAGTGKEVWQDKYEASAVTGPASGFSGPRSSPTVSDGKVATLGVQGTLSCLDAATGKLAWRNQNFLGSVPKFNTASSPIITDGLCIAQLGGERNGVLIAFDLATGKEKWKSKSDSPAYGSPVLMNIGGTEVIVAATEKTIIAVALVDGKNLWQIPYTQGRYNAVTPAKKSSMPDQPVASPLTCSKRAEISWHPKLRGITRKIPSCSIRRSCGIIFSLESQTLAASSVLTLRVARPRGRHPLVLRRLPRLAKTAELVAKAQDAVEHRAGTVRSWMPVASCSS
jgi:PQQ-like domain